MGTIIQEVCCKDRVLQLIKSIPYPFVKIEPADEYKSWFIFGNNGGVVEYRYKVCNICIEEWIKTIKDLGFIFKRNENKFIPIEPIIKKSLNEKDKILFRALNDLTRQFNLCLKFEKDKYFTLLNQEIYEYYYNKCKIILIEDKNGFSVKASLNDKGVYVYNEREKKWEKSGVNA